MKAYELANVLLSLKDNPSVILWQWVDNQSGYYGERQRLLNFASGKVGNGYFQLTSGLRITGEMIEDMKKDMVDNLPQDVIDYDKVLKAVMKQKKLLPTLIGIDKNFDKLIAEKLKEI